MIVIKRIFRSETMPIYVVLVLLCTVFLLSVLGVDPGFSPKTTPSRLYENILVNASTIVVIVAGLVTVRLSPSARRDGAALVFTGFLWGISAVSVLFFNTGLGVSLSVAAGFILRAHLCPVH